MLPRTLLTRADPAGAAEHFRVFGFGKAEVLRYSLPGYPRVLRQLQCTDKSSRLGEVLPFVACAGAFVLVTHQISDGACTFRGTLFRGCFERASSRQGRLLRWLAGPRANGVRARPRVTSLVVAPVFWTSLT